MLTFYLDESSGVPAYLQLVHQVTHALRLGLLEVGDQLPSVREVVAALVINPNTVLKAYRELERMGLVASRQGKGTFVARTLGGAPPSDLPELRRDLRRWLERAGAAGLDADSVLALLMSTFREAQERGEATA
jgi:GntR family transcriptional regulator